MKITEGSKLILVLFLLNVNRILQSLFVYRAAESQEAMMTFLKPAWFTLSKFSLWTVISAWRSQPDEATIGPAICKFQLIIITLISKKL